MGGCSVGTGAEHASMGQSGGDMTAGDLQPQQSEARPQECLEETQQCRDADVAVAPAAALEAELSAVAPVSAASVDAPAPTKRKDARSALAKKLGWGSPKRRRKAARPAKNGPAAAVKKPKELTPQELEQAAALQREREDAAIARALQQELGGRMYGGRKSRKPQVFDPVAEAARPQLAHTADCMHEPSRRSGSARALSSDADICCNICKARCAIKDTARTAEEMNSSWTCVACKHTRKGVEFSDQKRPSPPPGPPPTRRPVPPKESPTHSLGTTVIAASNTLGPQTSDKDTATLDADRATVAAIIASSTAAIQKEWWGKRGAAAQALDAAVSSSMDGKGQSERGNDDASVMQLDTAGPPTKTEVPIAATTPSSTQTTAGHLEDLQDSTPRVSRIPEIEAQGTRQASAPDATAPRPSKQAEKVQPLAQLDQVNMPSSVSSPPCNASAKPSACQQYVVGSSVIMAFEEPDGTLRDWSGRVDKIESGSGLMTISFEDGSVETDVDPADPDLRLRPYGRRLYGKQEKAGAPDAKRSIDVSLQKPQAVADEWTEAESEHLHKLVEQQGSGRWQAKALASGTKKSAGAVAQRYFSTKLAEQSDGETQESAYGGSNGISAAGEPTAVSRTVVEEQSKNVQGAVISSNRSQLGGAVYWTAEEDAQLNILVEKHGTGNWPSKSHTFSTPRTASSLRKRWKKLQDGRLSGNGFAVDRVSSDGGGDSESDIELDKELEALCPLNTDDVSLETLDNAILRRSTLVAWCVRKDFNQLVEDCLVRVAELGKGRERGYYTGLITGAFEFRQQYMVCGLSTAKGLVLRRYKRGIDFGQTETVRLNHISNLVPSREELVCISQEVVLLQKLTPDRVSVCTRAQELSRNLFTQAAGKEVARAKAMITKWNNLGNRKRLKDAISLHTKLIKAFEASDWQTMERSCPDFNPYSREIADDSTVWAMLTQVVDLASAVDASVPRKTHPSPISARHSAAPSSGCVATSSPRLAKGQRRHERLPDSQYIRGNDMNSLHNSSKRTQYRASPRSSNPTRRHTIWEYREGERQRGHPDSGESMDRLGDRSYDGQHHLASARSGFPRRKALAGASDDYRRAAVRIDLSTDESLASHNSSGSGDKRSRRQSNSPATKRQAVASPENNAGTGSLFAQKQPNLGRYRVLRRATVRAGCDRLSEVVGILEVDDTINVVQAQVSRDLCDDGGYVQQERLRFDTVSSGSGSGFVTLSGWASVHASNGGPPLLEYLGLAAVGTSQVASSAAGASAASPQNALLLNNQNFNSMSSSIEESICAAELFRQSQPPPAPQLSGTATTNLSTVDGTVAEMLEGLGTSLDLVTLEKTLKEQEQQLYREIMANMHLSEADIAALPAGPREQYLAVRAAHRWEQEAYAARGGLMPPQRHDNVDTCTRQHRWAHENSPASSRDIARRHQPTPRSTLAPPPATHQQRWFRPGEHPLPPSVGMDLPSPRDAGKNRAHPGPHGSAVRRRRRRGGRGRNRSNRR